jgi:hypothetical protein
VDFQIICLSGLEVKNIGGWTADADCGPRLCRPSGFTRMPPAGLAIAMARSLILMFLETPLFHLIGIPIRFKSDPGGWVAIDCGRQKPGCLGMTKGKHRKPDGCHGVFPPCGLLIFCAYGAAGDPLNVPCPPPPTRTDFSTANHAKYPNKTNSPFAYWAYFAVEKVSIVCFGK